MEQDKNGIPPEFGVFVEYLDGRFDQVLEGQQALGNRVDRVDNKLETFQEEVNFKFDAVFDEFAEFRAETNNHFASVDDQLKDIRSELDHKVNREELDQRPKDLRLKPA